MKDRYAGRASASAAPRAWRDARRTGPTENRLAVHHGDRPDRPPGGGDGPVLSDVGARCRVGLQRQRGSHRQHLPEEQQPGPRHDVPRSTSTWSATRCATSARTAATWRAWTSPSDHRAAGQPPLPHPGSRRRRRGRADGDHHDRPAPGQAGAAAAEPAGEPPRRHRRRRPAAAGARAHDDRGDHDPRRRRSRARSSRPSGDVQITFADFPDEVGGDEEARGA